MERLDRSEKIFKVFAYTMVIIFALMALYPIIYERQVMLMVANISGAVCLVLAGLVSIKRTNRRRKLQEALNE